MYCALLLLKLHIRSYRDCLLMSPVLTGNSIEAYNRISSGEGVLDAAKTLILEQSKLSICWPKYCGTGLFMSTNGFQVRVLIFIYSLFATIFANYDI